MMRTALAVALLCGAFATALRAEPACGDRDSIVQKLAVEYNETAGSRGYTDKGSVLEIFTSREGSWTIIVTTPVGGISLQSCLVAHGESWESLPAQLAANGEAS